VVKAELALGSLWSSGHLVSDYGRSGWVSGQTSLCADPMLSLLWSGSWQSHRPIYCKSVSSMPELFKVIKEQTDVHWCRLSMR